MKDKILMIAVATSAGYAGGKLGAAQVDTPDYLYAKKGVTVGADAESGLTRITAGGVSVSSAEGKVTVREGKVTVGVSERVNCSQITADGINVLGAKGVEGPVAFMGVYDRYSAVRLSGLSSAPGGRAYVTLTAGRNILSRPDNATLELGSDPWPSVYLTAQQSQAVSAVGLIDKNHIQTWYEHGSQSTIERVLASGRKALVSD